jgi:hypothetical protein
VDVAAAIPGLQENPALCSKHTNDQDGAETFLDGGLTARASTGERIKHCPSCWRHEPTEVAHEGDRLDGRMFAAVAFGLGGFGAILINP